MQAATLQDGDRNLSGVRRGGGASTRMRRMLSARGRHEGRGESREDIDAVGLELRRRLPREHPVGDHGADRAFALMGEQRVQDGVAHDGEEEAGEEQEDGRTRETQSHNPAMIAYPVSGLDSEAGGCYHKMEMIIIINKEA